MFGPRKHIQLMLNSVVGRTFGIFEITKTFISEPEMHFIPNVVWLTVVALTMRCCAGYPSQKQFVNIIKHVLEENEYYENILSEKVRLKRNEIPALYSQEVPDHDNVNPTLTLLALPVNKDTYSGKAVDLSVLIIGTSITCLLYKRFAIQLALVRRMIATETDQEQHLARAKVLAYMLPLGIDLLMITQTGHEVLRDLYAKVVVVAYQNGEQYVKNDFVTQLNDGLNMLNATIQSSCVNSNVKTYYRKFNFMTEALLFHFAADDFTANDFITEEFEISDKLRPSALTELMMENENAIMDECERLSVFRNMGMSTWNVLLGIPALSTNPKEFKRNSSLNSSGTIVKMLEKNNPYMSNVVLNKPITNIH